MKRAVCTVVARNYVPYARVLAESLAEHHRDVRLSVLILDDAQGQFGSGEPFDALRLEELGIRADELADMQWIYAAKELATAVKPALMRRLLDSGADAVLFLDPDILVTAPLDDVWEVTAESDTTLIPHSLRPFPDDGRTPSDRHIRRTGIFNGGFVGVGKGGRDFLDWWDSRLRLHCVVDVNEGLFVDQRWLDFVPSYFPYRILRDPTIDVAYWNLHDRILSFDDGVYLVDGKPLRFFHFSGFDPTRPDMLSRGSDRFVPTDDPALASLCTEYARRLLEAGYTELRKMRYDMVDPPSSDVERYLRREALVAGRAGGDLRADSQVGEGGALGSTAGELVRAYLRAGVNETRLSRRWGPLAGVLDRAISRFTKPVVEHQTRVSQALVEFVREEKDELRAEIRVLAARVAELENRS